MLRLLVLILMSHFVFSALAQNQYSIDDTRVDRKQRVGLFTRIRLKVHSWTHEDKQKKAEEKQRKRELKEEKRKEKAIEKFNEQQGKDKEITSGQRVSKRMKRMKKESNRVNHDKPRENFFQRLFSKNKQRPAHFEK
jgi:hypothetical protein